MADRLTQLQDTVNMQAENLCNSIGVLQQLAQPGRLSVVGGAAGGLGSTSPTNNSVGGVVAMGGGGGGGGNLANSGGGGNQQAGQQTTGFLSATSSQEDLAQLFATLIARAAKDIDQLIESLPQEESNPEVQIQSLKRLETENQEAAERLEQIVRNGEVLLHQIQQALADIADSQLEMDRSFALP